MVNKKVSGQTVAIILLAILLMLTVAFGGVYAYYSSSTGKVTGGIEMANLNITMGSGVTGESGSSIILISKGLYVPGQILDNTPLQITNKSTTKIYLSVLYSVSAYHVDDNTPPEDYDDSKPLIDIVDNNGVWHDYLYTAKDKDGNVKKDEGGNDIRYRCLITTAEVPADTTGKGHTVTVIGENKLRLPTSWGNSFQSMKISFKFQAFAIASASFDGEFTNTTTQDEKSEMIMQAIYKSYEYNIAL